MSANDKLPNSYFLTVPLNFSPMITSSFAAYFDSFPALGALEKEELSTRVTERSVKRRHFILQENEVCRHYSFIVEGCFRMFSVDNKGTEHTIQFAAENDWIADIGSFHSEKPGQLYIEAIEPAVILQLEKPELLHLYRHYPKVERYFRVTIENKFVELQQRLLQNISSSAEERYLSFVAQHPILSSRLPNTIIASYIGITPEFLSKIRKGIFEREPVALA